MIGSLNLEYAPQEQEAADIIASACRQALEVVKETWGLGTERLWSEIDGLIAGHFKREAAAGGPPPGPIA